MYGGTKYEVSFVKLFTAKIPCYFLTFLVIQSEGFPKFLLHRFRVLFYDELRGQRHELGELETTRL